MNALLGRAGLGGMGDAPRNNVCSSVDDLQRQLHNSVATRKTETRAEHISATFEIRHNTVFLITEEPENGVAEGGETLQQPQQQVTRPVSASETIQNQPADDPALQRAVTNHIVGAVGAVDGSTWNVRQVSRSTQGWTFTYLCRHSLQAWNRQNAKNPERPVIGSFSGLGGLDPINLSRPAFDCRGTLTIAFSKSSRAIVVKYEHTPLHTTVAQLVDRLAPVIPPPSVANGSIGNANRSAKAKRPPPAEGEEGGRKKRNKKDKLVDGVDDGQAAAAVDSSQAQTTDVTPGVHMTSILNIPPLESARRRELAISLLSGKNIDPVTLSAEQFNIFANQAPHLQEASLEMLAKYGAERLRIVHPDGKEQFASASSTPPQQNTPVTGATGTAPATPATSDTPSAKKRSRKNRSEAVIAQSTAEDVVPVDVEGGTTSLTMEPSKQRNRKTRGSCDTCKQNKRKCTKEHPQCSACVEAGDDCIYLPPKPRRKSEKSADIVEDDDPDVPVEAEQQDIAYAPPEPEPAAQLADQTAQVAPMDPDNDEFSPDPNILTAPIEQSSGPPLYYQPNDATLAFPQAPTPQQAAPQHSAASGLNFSQTQIHRESPQPSPGVTFPSNTQLAQQLPGLAYQIPPSTAYPSPPNNRATSRNNNRRGLPSVQASESRRGGTGGAARGQPASSWNNMPSSPAIPGNTSTQSPIISKQQTNNRPKSRMSGAESSPQVFDGIHAALALTQAATQQQQNRTPGVTKSPYQQPVQQPSARAKSRQGHTSETPIPSPKIPTSHHTTSSPSYNTPTTTTSTSSSIPTYGSFVRYNSETNDQYSHSSNDQSSSRVAYEPRSYTQTSSASAITHTAPSYDYSRSTGSNNPLSQALNETSDYGSASTSHTNQWSAPQARASQPTATSAATTTTTTTNPYNLSNNTQTSPSHSYGTRSAQRQASNPTYNPSQQQHSYGSYSSQQPTTSQQQSQNWYGFTSAKNNSNSASYSSNARNTAYGSNSSSSGSAGYNQGQRSHVPVYHGYNNNEDIYDLLRTGGSSH